jgi:hypothetical protein
MVDMYSLVEALEAQHRALEILVGSIDEAIVHRDLDIIPVRLRALASAIDDHLRLEDAQLYPAFERAIGRVPKVVDLDLARLFSKNMRLIADGLTTFFARYRQPPADLTIFAREWKATVDVLSHRIVAEESTLHPMLLRLPVSAPAGDPAS